MGQVPEFIFLSTKLHNLGSCLPFRRSTYESQGHKTKLTILKTLRYSLEPFDITDKKPTHWVSQKQHMSARLLFLSLVIFRVLRPPAFALASHEAGLRTAAESKSGPLAPTHY